MESMPEIRKRRLRQWIDEHCEGSQTRFVRGTDMTTAMLGQWLGGHRNMREDSAREIERKKRMPRGWLDERPESAAWEKDPEKLATLIQGMTAWDERTIAIANAFQAMAEEKRRVVEAVINSLVPQEQEAA